MSDILQSIRIQAPAAQVLASLNSIDGLAGWWTRTTSGDATPGGHIDFRFGEHVTRVRVETVSVEGVHWTVVDSNPDWNGTRLTFDLEADGERTLLKFGHRDWTQAGGFFAHCSMKWATFLLSLRAQVEHGEGRPFPDDLAI
ncbi:MAG: hypothetical protein ACI9VR_003036 [Cognaticolwellia sp.]|jgi:hypothetical protein